MSLKSSDIDHIIELIEQIAEALSKTDFLSQEEQWQLIKWNSYKMGREHEMLVDKLNMVNPKMSCGRSYHFDKEEDERCRKAINFDEKALTTLENKLAKAKQKHIESTIAPLQKKLDLYLSPRRPEISPLSERERFSEEIKAFLCNRHLNNYDVFSQDIPIYSGVLKQKEEIVGELERIKAKLEYNQAQSIPATVPAKRCKIRTWLWKLYEVTLKSFWEAFWEKVLRN